MFDLALKFLIPILSFASSSGIALITNWIRSREDFRLKELECNTQITIANIQANNSRVAREVEIQKMLSEHSIEIEKMFVKNMGIKFVDGLRASIRPIMALFVMFMFAYIGQELKILNNLQLMQVYLDNFYSLTALVFGYYMVDRSLNKGRIRYV